MPELNTETYKPGFFFRYGHINTIFTALLKKPPKSEFNRERIETPDGDFLDIDKINNHSEDLLVLCHGLEGSSKSRYVRSTSHLFASKGFDICAMNYRYCSGEINRTPQLYHSGYTIDLNTVLNHVEKPYKNIYIIGFSLGGNLVLKYAGKRGRKINQKIKAICAISAPLHLHSSSLEIMKFENYVYTKKFLITLIKKLKLKKKQFPNHFDLSTLSKVRNVYDFDEYFTGPLNGFADAKDYYAQCSSLQFLENISVPALIINARDDHFLSDLCYPTDDKIGNNANVHYVYPQYGGHVGFYQKETYCWNENLALGFFQSIKSK